MYQPKSYRKFLTAGMTAAVAASAIVPAAVAAETQDFTDVQAGDSHYEAIMSLTEQGVIQGYPDGSFGVNEDLSRRHAAVLFTNAIANVSAPEDVTAIVEAYADVTADNTYAAEIAAVTEANIFKGDTEGNFNPLADLTREQMATVLVNAFGLADTGEELDINLDNVSPSHKANVKVLAQHGITNQLDDFRPDEAVTRGQFATFLHLTMATQGEVTASFNFKNGLTAFDKLVEVTLEGATNPEAYTVTVMDQELEYKDGKFVGLVNSTDEAKIKESLVLDAPEAPVEDVAFEVNTKNGLTAFDSLVEVKLDTEADADYNVTVLGEELEYKADKDVFVGLVNSTDEEAIKAGVVVTAK